VVLSEELASFDGVVSVRFFRRCHRALKMYHLWAVQSVPPLSLVINFCSLAVQASSCSCFFPVPVPLFNASSQRSVACMGLRAYREAERNINSECRSAVVFEVYWCRDAIGSCAL